MLLFHMCRAASENSRIFNVLEDIIEHTFLNLHYIQKNLEFWQSKAEVSDQYFIMVDFHLALIFSRSLKFFVYLSTLRSQMLEKHTS